MPSGRRTSAGPPTLTPGTARSAFTACHHTGAPLRRSTVLAHTRNPSRSRWKRKSAATVHTGRVHTSGSCNASAGTASSTTTGRRATHARCNRSAVSLPSASTPASTPTRTAVRSASGTACPGSTTAPRPNPAGPDATAVTARRPAPADP